MTTNFEKLLANYPPSKTGQYQVLGWRPVADFESLLKSIDFQQQVQLPIVKDDKGNTLDGHHRELGHKLLKIKEPLKVQTLGKMPEAEKRYYALTVNLVRRQVTRKQRREIIAEELRRTPDLSSSALSNICGTTTKTVETIKKEMIANGEIPQLDRVRRRNGGTYPVPHIVTAQKKAAERAQKALSQLGEDAPKKPITMQNAEYMAKAKHRDEVAKKPLPKLLPSDIHIVHADFRKLKIADNSIDLILTDPPYQKTELHLWREMAELAACALKPGGHLVAYSGIVHLPEVFAALCNSLEYVWTISISQRKGLKLIQKTQSRSAWRPVLVSCKGKYQPNEGFDDMLDGSQSEKKYHDWQQPLPEARYFVEKFSKPGDLVLDPFAGSFTNAIASYELGRRFLGCDIEEKNVRLGKHRLAEAVKAEATADPVAGRVGPTKRGKARSA